MQKDSEPQLNSPEVQEQLWLESERIASLIKRVGAGLLVTGIGVAAGSAVWVFTGERPNIEVLATSFGASTLMGWGLMCLFEAGRMKPDAESKTAYYSLLELTSKGNPKI